MKDISDEVDGRLTSIATRFRATLELLGKDWDELIGERYDLPTDLSGRFGIIKCFPWSCCEIASVLLLRYLAEQGFSNVRLVNGTLRWRTSSKHEWVEVNGIIIDLTADQFEHFRERPAPVIVTTDRTWHRRFGKRSYQVYTEGWADFTYYNIEHRRLLGHLYEFVVSLISSQP